MSYFAITVLSGKEKRIRKRVCDSSLIHHIKGIYTLNEYHCVGENETKEIINVLDLNEYELVNYIKLIQSKEYIERIHQLITTNPLSSSQQLQLNNEITRLTNEIDMMQPNKQLHLLKGYLLIDFNEEYSELPSDLYNQLKAVEGVISIPSKLAIPQNEIQNLFKNSTSLQIQEEDFYTTQQEVKQILNKVQEAINI